MRGSPRRKYSTLFGTLAFMFACSCGESKKSNPDAPAAATPVGASATTPLPMPADTTPPANLDGTRWRLVEIQSMSDAQSTIRPDDPSKYTLSFDSEGGFLTMGIDCNRASGNYEKTASDDRRSGSLKIAPLKITRAQCAPSSLADRVARDMEYVRTYRFVNGRLSLDLMADGGIYIWERQPK